MRNALCNLAFKSFIAFSVSIIRLVEYVVSGFSMLYWKPRFKSFAILLLSIRFLLNSC